MDTTSHILEAVSLASSIASIIVTIFLGAVAIWQSAYFYTQGKATENRVEVALAGIKTQTETLKDLTGTLLTRLTKYVTTPRPDAEQTMRELAAMSAKIDQLPKEISRVPANGARATEEFQKGAIELYIMVWYYTGQTNVVAALHLPPLNLFNPSDPLHEEIKRIVDSSAADFYVIAGLIANFDQHVVGQSPRIAIYNETRTRWAPLVGDTMAQLMAVRHGAPPGSEPSETPTSPT